jgi:uncharacterized protein GlcG (DUF336 family)
MGRPLDVTLITSNRGYGELQPKEGMQMRGFSKVIAAILTILGTSISIVEFTPNTALAADITLAQAINVFLAAQARATAIGVPMDIAIVDRGGRLRVFGRMDGAWIGSIDIAQAKAFTATAFCNDFATPACVNTSQLQSLVQPGGPLFGLQATNRKDGIVAFPGGVTLCAGLTPIGALGVSGGAVAQDQDVASTAADATGFTCQGQ